MTCGSLSMAGGGIILGIITSQAITTATKIHNSGKALEIIQETAPSIDGLTDEKMIALLKTQGITMNVEELAKCRQKYNSLSEKERLQLIAQYADTPLWPWLAGGVVGFLAFCVMGARWGFIN